MLRMRYLLALLLPALLAACGAPGSVAYPNPSAAYPNPSAAAAYPNPSSALPPATCGVTRAPSPAFVPPAPYPANPPAEYVGQFWYGTPDLWTILGSTGTWKGLQLGANGYAQKLFWWSQAYSASAEPKPALTITATRLDASAPPVTVSEATNGSTDFGDAMLVGVTLPTGGCWSITGHYHAHELNFVVWAAP